MKAKRTLLVILVAAGMLSFTNGCQKYNTVPVTIDFVLSNGSDLDTHMWISGESIGAGNKVSPGSTRSLTETFQVERSGTEITVSVGRNGQQIGFGKTTINQTTTAVTAFWDGTYLAVTAN